MVRYPPPWYLILHRHIRAIPHFATYRAIIVRYPLKTSTRDFCDTIATSITRYEKYRCWASKVQERKSSLNIKFLGGMSRRRPGGYPGGRPSPKTLTPSLAAHKNKVFARTSLGPKGADVHDPRVPQKNFMQENFGPIFRSLLAL